MSSNRSSVAAQKVLEAFRSGAIIKAAELVFVPQALAEDAPCRHWSLGNRLLAALSGSADARTFKQWLEAGRAVRKGEKARGFIFLPVFSRRKEDGDEVEEERVEPVAFFAKVVFGYPQTDGEPIPAYAEQGSFLSALPLVEVAEAWGVPVRASSELVRTGALGLLQHSRQIEGAQIVLSVENPEVFLHELVHAAELRRGTLHPGRSERPGKEIVAEFGAQMLLAALGHPPVSDRSFEYLSHYAKVLDLDPEAAALRFLERTAAAVEMVLQTAEELATQTAAA